MAHIYSHLFGIPATTLRLFTVYGLWGRPDMAPMIFAKSILNNEVIKVFNNGEMIRDFTYIDDVAEVIYRCSFKPAIPNIDFDRNNPDPSTSFAPHRIFNVVNSNAIKLIEFIESLENVFGKKAIKIFKTIQDGDVKETLSNSAAIQKWIDYRPSTSFDEGIKCFAEWYTKFFKDEI